MLKRISLFTLTTALVWNFTAVPAQEQHLVIVPGQNGMGGQNLDWVFPQYAFACLKKEKNFVKHIASTPSTWLSIDFGQQNCQSHIDQVFKNKNLTANDRIVGHYSSQGTATGINFAAKNPNLVKALILESVMLSGNSAISHTVENKYCSFISYIPFSYYWLPYLIKPVFPGYAPAGEQAIFNIDKLPTDLPIIILHHTKDPQLSFKDAQALYAFLKQTQGNKNVYLIPKESNYQEHVLLLRKKHIQEISTINSILELNGPLTKDPDILNDHDLEKPINEMPHLFVKYTDSEKHESEEPKLEFNHEMYREMVQHYQAISSTTVNLQQFQPEVKQEWIKHFNNTLIKEKRFWYVDWIAKTTIPLLIIYLAYKHDMLEKILNKISFSK